MSVITLEKTSNVITSFWQEKLVQIDQGQPLGFINRISHENPINLWLTPIVASVIQSVDVLDVNVIDESGVDVRLEDFVGNPRVLIVIEKVKVLDSDCTMV